jgi:nitrate reductase NapE component
MRSQPIKVAIGKEGHGTILTFGFGVALEIPSYSCLQPLWKRGSAIKGGARLALGIYPVLASFEKIGYFGFVLPKLQL